MPQVRASWADRSCEDGVQLNSYFTTTFLPCFRESNGQQQLPLGEGGLIMRILSFNVGVEIGQVLALGIMLLIISGWRTTRSFSQFSTLSNWGSWRQNYSSS